MEKDEKKLFLLDAMALIYRAYFALNKNPRVTSTGINTSAFLGFANTLLELLRKEKPTHIGVAFDTMAPSARKLEYTDYKANREKMPEDIGIAIPYIRRLLEALHIPVLISEGYEADDIIGTLSKRAESEGFTVYMVTPDKDFGQLVSEHIYMYKPAHGGNGVEIMGPGEVCKKFGIENPLQVIDMLGLWGDAADNIPGIPGVGEVTARKLLAQFGSMENMFAHSDEIQNEKLREKVRLYEGQGRESKMLATIILDVPVEFNEAELRLSAPDIPAVSALLNELEMRTFAARLLSYYGESTAVSAQAMQSVSGRATQSVSARAMQSTFGQMPRHSLSATDRINPAPTEAIAAIGTNPAPTEFIAAIGTNPAPTEAIAASGINPAPTEAISAIETNPAPTEAQAAKPASEEFLVKAVSDSRVILWKDVAELKAGLEKLSASGKKTGFYLHPAFSQNSIRHAETDYMAFSDGKNLYGYCVPRPGEFSAEEKTALAAFLFRKDALQTLSCYDLKTQLHLLTNIGITGELKVFDVLLAHYLIEPETGHDLMRLTRNYLACGYAADTAGQDLFSVVDARFCLQNAEAARRLREIFEPRLEEVRAKELFEEVELPLASVLCRMEREGVRIDTARLAAYGKELEAEIGRVEKEIYTLAGRSFNISSPKQLGEILFDELRITDKPKQTRNKQYSTAEDVLQKLVHKHPVVEKVLRYRSLSKLKSTYIDTLPQLIDPKTGRIHTTYNQAVTATGRLSSQNPNLQNIPVRTELGKEIRRCFIPLSDEDSLLAADYSQIELRIIAHLSGDETMLQDFNRHKDVHTATAANVFGVKPEAVTGEMRRKAKTVNFGIIYGISAFGLAERLQIPRKEAAELIERYFANYSRLQGYMEKAVAEAKEKGYVETLLHRRRYLQDINSGNAVVRAFAERNAINAPVQGSSADMIKLAMIAIDRRIREENMRSRMILQVHDELVFNTPEEEVGKLRALVESEMKNALPMRVPVEVEVNVANNWLEAH